MLKASHKWVLGVVLLLILILPFLMAPHKGDAELFTGADSQAEGLIGEITPGYKPWFNPVFEPPSGEIESLLFSLQAALGAGVIGYYVGYNRRKSGDEA